jgi:HTH-type transcriptional regulator / antitoxin HigA
MATQILPPGEFIREELEARGWTQATFAHILGRPLQAINQIINGKKAITAQTAKEIAAAFGTSAEVWMNLEVAWQLHSAPKPDGRILQRVRQVA